MKSICYDVHHAIARRWFLAALIATTVALYLSVGQATYGLIGYLESYELFEENSFGYSMTDMLTMGMKGDFGLLTLPALSALPFAAQALHEIKSGAIRPAVFRTGRNSWIIGKAAGCVISGMLLQGAAVGLLLSNFRAVVPVCAVAFHDPTAVHGTKKQKSGHHRRADAELRRVCADAGSVYDLAESALGNAVLRQPAVGMAFATPTRHLLHAQLRLRSAAPVVCFLSDPGRSHGCDDRPVHAQNAHFSIQLHRRVFR